MTQFLPTFRVDLCDSARSVSAISHLEATTAECASDACFECVITAPGLTTAWVTEITRPFCCSFCVSHPSYFHCLLQRAYWDQSCTFLLMWISENAMCCNVSRLRLWRIHFASCLFGCIADVNAAIFHAFGLLVAHAMQVMALHSERRAHSVKAGPLLGTSLKATVFWAALQVCSWARARQCAQRDL